MIDIKKLESMPSELEFEALLMILEEVGGNIEHIRKLNDEYWASIYDEEFAMYKQLSRDIRVRLKILYQAKGQ